MKSVIVAAKLTDFDFDRADSYFYIVVFFQFLFLRKSETTESGVLNT